MEPAKIDWETIDSEFIPDEIYEHINAPQWVDFLAAQRSAVDHDGQDWFCRPDCKHPRTYDDFLKSTPASSKLLRSASVSKLMAIGDWYRRDGNMKRRGIAQDSGNEDSENQNPNLSTPPCQVKSMKAAIKSSAEQAKELPRDNGCSKVLLQGHEKPRLKSTLSARDLFGGKDIFNKITEFCNELKRMATRKREEEINDVDVLSAKKRSLESKNDDLKDGLTVKLEEFDGKEKEKEKERKPLLEVSKERYEPGSRSNNKEKLRKKKRAEEAENIPITLNLENVKSGGQKCLSSIRTSPPTPQCFSATRDPARVTPSKGPKSRLLTEKEILHEMEKNKLPGKEICVNAPEDTSVIAGRDGKTLDMFWLFKPCTLSS